MFFEISKKTNDLFGSTIHLPNGLIFNSDLGWKEYNIDSIHIVYKGYHTESFSQELLFKNMLKDHTPRYKGSFYMIISNNTQTVVTHNIDRSSPLVLGQDSISNLFTVSNDKETNLWADRYVTVDKNFNTDQKILSTYGNTFLEYSFDTALKLVDNLICESFENFLTHNTRPIKVFLSGGIDTLTVYTYLDKFTKNYEILDYEYNKFTHFYRNNFQSRLRKFWAYQQIHSWGEVPTVLMTGACGDEYFLRGPTTANMMLLHYNIDVLKELEKHPTCYHYDYFKRDKNIKLFNDQKNNSTLLNQCKNKDTTIKNILNILVNDHQHWHIDETLFFTPFKNLKIAEILLGLPKNDLLQQVLDARFQKELIKNIDSSKITFLSKFKNFEYLKYPMIPTKS
jgi:hypothetical protein